MTTATMTCSEDAVEAAVKAIRSATRGDGTGSEEADRARRRSVRDALRTYCRSDAHLEAVTGALVRSCRFFPTVAEVISHIEETPPPSPLASARTNCPECGGSGMLRTGITATAGVYRGMRYSAVRWCPCRRLA